jgi:hypothetical protein
MSCSRIRQQLVLSSFALFGSYLVNRTVYVVGSDGLRNSTCYRLRLTGPGGVYEVPFSFDGGSALPLAVDSPPPVTEPTPPAGEPTADTLLRAVLPDVALPGD